MTSEWTVEEHESVGSTQDVLRERLSDGVRPPLAIRARRQQSGRGRRGRSWESPEGGLWASLGLAVATPADPFLGLIAGLSALEAVAETLPPDTKNRLALKWPNDLLVVGGPGSSEQKWGGVIGEVESAPGGGLWLLVGIGLNLDIPADLLPAVPPPGLPATSIAAEFGRAPSPAQVLPRILARLDRRISADRGPSGRLRSIAEISAALSTLGRDVRWHEPGRAASGTTPDALHSGHAIALAEDGGLVVEEDPSGAPSDRVRRVLRAGEIEHLRDPRGS